MERFVVFLFVIMLSACAAPGPKAWLVPRDHASEVTENLAAPLATRGAAAAAELTNWYNDKVNDCGNSSLPAPLCSGVMLRATENSPAFLPWDPSNASITSGGVSFSWLRVDTNFSNLVYSYRNGFIFYPVLRTPPGKNSNIAVLCVFPHDAGSNDRPTLQGCGANAFYPADSRPCTDQGINTAAQWLAKFDNSGSPYHYQCGWSVRQGEWDQAARFMAAIGARRLMANILWVTQNELRLATWATGSGASLPIQSFFYISDDLDARAKAKNDQLRYFQQYGQEVPVIRVALSVSREGWATFTYSEDDQMDPAPDELRFDTSPAYVRGVAYIIPQRPDVLPRFEGSNSVTRTAFGGRPPYTYATSNTSVAVVSSMGTVTPRQNGTATISVTDSAGNRASYPVTFTGVVQVRYAGRLTYQQAQAALTNQGEYMPDSGELGDMQLVFGGRWPYSTGVYWSTLPCNEPGWQGAFFVHTLEREGRCGNATTTYDAVGLK